MAKATFVVLTNPVSADAEDEYNDWYNNVHLNDVVAVDGFVSAQRFRIVNVDALGETPQPSHRYLALYEVETDDLDAVARELTTRAGDAMVISPALDASSALAFFVEPIAAPVLAS